VRQIILGEKIGTPHKGADMNCYVVATRADLTRNVCASRDDRPIINRRYSVKLHDFFLPTPAEQRGKISGCLEYLICFRQLGDGNIN
jgi:hypothetical protein